MVLKLMQKKRNKPVPRDKREKPGIQTSILDRKGNCLVTGDRIKLRSTGDEGVFLYHAPSKRYGLFYGLWYGDKNPNDARCYGKSVIIPADNGMRMEIEKVENNAANRSVKS